MSFRRISCQSCMPYPSQHAKSLFPRSRLADLGSQMFAKVDPCNDHIFTITHVVVWNPSTLAIVDLVEVVVELLFGEDLGDVLRALGMVDEATRVEDVHLTVDIASVSTTKANNRKICFY